MSHHRWHGGRSVRHYHRRFQHQTNQGDDPWVLHAFGDPGLQPLMMNSVEGSSHKLPITAIFQLM